MATVIAAADDGAAGPTAAGTRSKVPADVGALEAVRALTRVARVLERASGGLSLAHFRVLAAVAAGDERASRVADRLAVGKPTVSASVDALCARELLSRSPVAEDQRAIRLCLTSAGKELLEHSEESMVSVLEALAERTGRRDDVIGALGVLGVALDEAAAERCR